LQQAHFFYPTISKEYYLALSQEKIIEKVKIQEGEIKLRNKDNNNQNTHNNGGNPNQSQPMPQ